MLSRLILKWKSRGLIKSMANSEKEIKKLNRQGYTLTEEQKKANLNKAFKKLKEKEGMISVH